VKATLAFGAAVERAFARGLERREHYPGAWVATRHEARVAAPNEANRKAIKDQSFLFSIDARRRAPSGGAGAGLDPGGSMDRPPP
jgi:hypothetical protein